MTGEHERVAAVVAGTREHGDPARVAGPPEAQDLLGRAPSGVLHEHGDREAVLLAREAVEERELGAREPRRGLHAPRS